MIDGKALWAPWWGQPCDCIDDCDCAEPVSLLCFEALDGSGEAWVTNPFHTAVQISEDQVETVGDWVQWTDLSESAARQILPRLLAAQPWPIRSTALFRRANLEPLLADGCQVLPTDQNLRAGSPHVIHAVMRGEDRIGWICPADHTKPGVVAGDGFMRIHSPNDTVGARA